jgi:hypothetical protein
MEPRDSPVIVVLELVLCLRALNRLLAGDAQPTTSQPAQSFAGELRGSVPASSFLRIMAAIVAGTVASGVAHVTTERRPGKSRMMLSANATIL